MELSQEQFEAIIEEVTRRIRPALTAGSDPATEETGEPSSSQAAGRSRQPAPAMVVLPPEFYESQREISDRVARLEERFVQFDKRFEQMQTAMDKRFESVDKRFEEINRRFNGLVALISVFATVISGLIVLL